MFVAFAFAGPDPLGELMRSFRALVAVRQATSKWREVRGVICNCKSTYL